MRDPDIIGACADRAADREIQAGAAVVIGSQQVGGGASVIIQLPVSVCAAGGLDGKGAGVGHRQPVPVHVTGIVNG